MSRVRFQETEHRVHDYRRLVQRWKHIARGAGLKLWEIARAGDYPVYALETRGAASDPAGLFLSAGIHGDEPAAPEALAQWAERHLARLASRSFPVLILPCVNPWGLVNNKREDENGRDLNRIFNCQEIAPVGAIRDLLRGRRFELAVDLHEDYDARGIYLYELARRAPDLGRDLLEKVSSILPTDTRARIDGRPAKDGVMLRRANLQRVPLHPAAIYVYLNQCDRVLTLETPSEFSLARRIKAHVKMLEVCLDWTLRARAAALAASEEKHPAAAGSGARRKSSVPIPSARR